MGKLNRVASIIWMVYVLLLSCVFAVAINILTLGTASAVLDDIANPEV